jgi:cytochrome P450
MKESVRRYGMLMLVRMAMKDVPFTAADGREFIIPKGRTVACSPFLSHHNSEVYPAPSRYDPERFADPERKQSLVSNRHYVQFGFGPHKCLVRVSPSSHSRRLVAVAVAVAAAGSLHA